MADFVRPSFKELSAVSLTRPINAQGVAVPAGARGVVMAAYPDGLAYEVEFEESHLVLTIEGEDFRG
jgi:hypothetical protein